MDYSPKDEIDRVIAEYNIDVDSTTLVKVQINRETGLIDKPVFMLQKIKKKELDLISIYITA